MDQIIIKQKYFDNIKVAINSINQFFESGFENKNFPAETDDLEWSIANIIDMLKDLDAQYVSDNNKLDNTLEEIKAHIEEHGDESTQQIMSDRPTRNAIQSVIAYVALQAIADNFQLFSKFINGIYTFELFMKPSLYRDAITKFTANLELPYEFEDLDLEIQIFSVDPYVSNLMNNPDITFSDTIDTDKEIQRILEFRDIQNTKVIVDDKQETPADNTPVQEAATEVPDKLTKDSKPQKESKFTGSGFICKNIKYDPESHRYMISEQYKKWTDQFITNLRKCNDIKELKQYLMTMELPSKFVDIPFPYIIVQAVKKRFNEKDFSIMKMEMENIFNKKKKEKSVARFKDYSIYDTFKSDKEGTIKYIEDYLRLNLINNKMASISNNVILALFNIFDSRMYLETLFNASEKFNMKDSESFVTDIRSRINRNSRNTNPYQTDTNKSVGNPSAPTKDVQESVEYRLKMMGDISLEEIALCESYKHILYDEISCISDFIYNNGYSINDVEEFIGESFVYTEAYNHKNRPSARGEIPEYMKSRMDLSDGDDEEAEAGTPDKPIDVADPLGEPENPLDDLADSVDEKMDMDGDLDELIGSKFKDTDGKSKGIVYNITYNNSFNKTSNDMSSNTNSHNTSNDLSEGKSNTHNTNSHNSTTDLSEGKSTTTTTTTSHSNNSTANSNNRTRSNSHSNNTTRSNTNSNNTTDTRDSHDTISNSYNRDERNESIDRVDNMNIESTGKNNNDNSNHSLDSKEFEDREFSNGMTVEEMFTFLESEEPLSNEMSSIGKPPKPDSLTRALDRDRKSLSKQQEAKKKLQKFGNTVRATLKPVTRTKQWLTGMVNSLVERDENKVKEEIIENPSYRTALYKGCRLAIKLGLTGVAFTISGYLGAAVAALQIARFADKQRLRREVQDEMVVELKIMQEKIDHAREIHDQKELYKLMRLKGKMERIAADSARGRWKYSKPDGRKNWY